ncbi:MAG: hypothetical protein J7513_07180 [Solirubrobacteraceae bacterium]|nr:hypothetical protein [Solirubrobacteraceae bacterium]
MKRQFMIATLAAAAIGVAGCGSEETAGKDIGYGVGALQATTAKKIANERLEGIRAAIDGAEGKLPDETITQLREIDEKLEDHLETAENHPEELAEASITAAKAITALSGDESVEQFKKAFVKAYTAGSGQTAP